MWERAIYLRSGRRRPIRRAPYRPGDDLQGALPAGWCEKCGREVYGFGERLCAECERWGQNEGKATMSAATALQRLHPGTQSC